MLIPEASGLATLVKLPPSKSLKSYTSDSSSKLIGRVNFVDKSTTIIDPVITLDTVAATNGAEEVSSK